MFEYVKQRDPVATVFYCGCIPFGLAWALHPSLMTGFALETYLISTGVFVLNPFEMQKQRVKQRWFWRIMLRAGAPVHSFFLVGLWLLDRTSPAFVMGTGTIFIVSFAVSMCEIVILGETVRRFAPPDQ
jgi:hypothetical protein